MEFNQPVSHLIQKRFSCRTYQSEPIKNSHLVDLESFIANCNLGPFGSDVRFKIIAAQDGDSRSLRGLGTYGFIKNPTGFIIGACSDLPGSLEDFGYLLETLLLRATDLGIGTCWLGGTFTKSRFVQAMNLKDGEIIPSVASIGYPADEQAWMDRISRSYAGADRRLAWKDLFFLNNFLDPLSENVVGDYHVPIESVRLAPSASNRQPWRIIKHNSAWHFYLKRTPNYPTPFFDRLLDLADLQRIDIGIAMVHFELSAMELNLGGAWQVSDPGINLPDIHTEYCVSWQETELE